MVFKVLFVQQIFVRVFDRAAEHVVDRVFRFNVLTDWFQDKRTVNARCARWASWRFRLEWYSALVSEVSGRERSRPIVSGALNLVRRNLSSKSRFVKLYRCTESGAGLRVSVRHTNLTNATLSNNSTRSPGLVFRSMCWQCAIQNPAQEDKVNDDRK